MFNHEAVPDVDNLEYSIEWYKRSLLSISIRNPSDGKTLSLSCIPSYLRCPHSWTGGRLIPASRQELHYMKSILFDSMRLEDFESMYSMYVFPFGDNDSAQILGSKFQISTQETT